MRRFFGWLLRVLILIVVGLTSFLTAMRFAIHGREVPVPNFSGLSMSQAENLAESNGLQLLREDRFYSREVPVGRIMSQEPPAGEKVRRGWRVRVAESLGPQSVSIPSVLGQSERAAELNLQRRGLEIGTVASVSLPNHAGDEIIAQSPPAGAQGITSPKVHLLYNASGNADAAYVMPDFVGATLANATAAIQQAGLAVGTVRTVMDNSAAAAKPQTEPAPNAAAAPATNAAVTVAPAAVAPKPAAPVATGETYVAAQSPSAGQKVSVTTPINFDVIKR